MKSRENPVRHEPSTRDARGNHEKESKEEGIGGQPAQNKARRPTDNDKAEEIKAPETVDKTTTWSEVVGRKEKAARNKKSRQEAQKSAAQREQRMREKQPVQKEKHKSIKHKIKSPRRAAVALTVAPGSTRRCEEVLATARSKIHLSESPMSK